MFRKVLLFRNLIDNIPKNIGLYSVGVMLLVLFHVTVESLQLFFGLLAFIVSYSSIYVLNDLCDVDIDRKDERKVLRKPLAQGVIKPNEAVKIFLLFLILGFLLSILVNLLFFCVVISLVFINLLYSIPLKNVRNQSIEGVHARQLKQTMVGSPLVLLIQLLKIFLPWTISAEVVHFPVLFAIGSSLFYVIIFRGYKEYLTIGQSVKQAPFSFGIAIIVFVLSANMYPEPLVQSSIVAYILAGVVFFRNSHLTDRRVLLLSPVYIFLGIIILFFMILNT